MSPPKRVYHSEDEYSEYSDEEDDTNKKDEKIERLQKENQRLQQLKGVYDEDGGQLETRGFHTFGMRKDEKWSAKNECSLKRNKTNFYNFPEFHTDSHGDCYGCLLRSETISSSRNTSKRMKKPIYSLCSVVCYVLSEALLVRAKENTTSEDIVPGQTEKIHFCKTCLDSRFYSAIQKYVSCTRLSHEFLSPSKFKEFVAKEKSPLLQLCNSDEFFTGEIDSILEEIRIRNVTYLFHQHEEEESIEKKDGKENDEENFSSKSVRTMEYRSGLYIGDVKILPLRSALPDGHGSFHWNLDGRSKKPALSYTGSWKNGLYHGYGELCCGKITYIGNFKDGKKHDPRAKVFFAGIEIFSGGFENDLRHGPGISTSLCGTRKTSGKFHHGQKHGIFSTNQNVDGVEMTVLVKFRENCIDETYQSTIVSMKTKYTGATTRSYPFLPHGNGTMVDEEKHTTYTGSWVHGKKCGKGRLEDEDSIYFGTWKEDLRDGHFAVVSKQSGEKEEMYFRKDMVIDIHSSDSLTKEFWFEVTLLSHVQELFPFSSIISYRTVEKSCKGLYYGESKYVQDRLVPHGKGKIQLFGQGMYTGDWYEGMMHGKGTLIVSANALGAEVLEYTGDFHFGIMQGEGSFKYKNGSTFEGTVMDGSPNIGVLHYSVCSKHPLNDTLKAKYVEEVQKRVDAKYEAIKVAYEEKVQFHGYTKAFDEEKAHWRAEQERLSIPRVSHYQGEFLSHEFHGQGVLYDSWNNIIEEGRYDYGRLASTVEEESTFSDAHFIF